MEIKTVPSSWKAVKENEIWQIRDKDGKLISKIEPSPEDESQARLIATSPYLLKVLKGMVALIGDDDLEDNGELSGAAICDMARDAVAMALGVNSFDWESYLGDLE
ncbi:MAG: hypothetical protein GY845_09935 [Planctomycetes bacterium]|nr:hypothetical protein [Planctomycetota bacterium]